MAEAGPLRYLLDEDINADVVAAARSLGLDVTSVHQIGRRGLSDFDQLRLAAADARIFVTRNRDDFIALTMEAFRTGAPHHGVLIVPYTLPNRHPTPIARALAAWHSRMQGGGHPGAYFIDFVS